MRCKDCGTIIPEEYSVCPFCGGTLEDEDTEETQKTKRSLSESGFLKILLTAVIAAVLVVVFLMAALAAARYLKNHRTPSGSDAESTVTETAAPEPSESVTVTAEAAVNDSAQNENEIDDAETPGPKWSDTEPADTALQEAEQLWSDEKYDEAAAAFQALASENKLHLDIKTISSRNDPVAEYAVVCSLKSLRDNNLFPDLYEVAFYDCSDLDLSVDGFDFTEPVICFETNYGAYLCAYNTGEHTYEFWCSEDTDLAQVNLVEKKPAYSLVELDRARAIRDTLYGIYVPEATEASVEEPEEEPEEEVINAE